MEAKSIESLAEELGRAAREHGARIATAESCTAGGISYAITSVPGSSGWFDRGFVTYTERSKIEMLGVPMGVIRSRGVVRLTGRMRLTPWLSPGLPDRTARNPISRLGRCVLVLRKERHLVL